VSSHSVVLSGLAPSTTYHFRVDSGNSNGLTQSADNTFATTTAPANPVIDTKVSAFSATGTVTASVTTSDPSDVLVAFVSGDQPSPPAGQTAAVTGGGSKWSMVQRTNAQPGTAEIWSVATGSVLTNAPITAKLTQATNVELTVIAFKSSGVGAVGGGSGGSGAPTATVTTTRANSWVFGVGFDWTAGNARTVGANQTLQDQLVRTGGTFWTQSQSAPTPASGTAVTINDTAPTSDQWDLALVEVMAPTSSQPPPVISAVATSGVTSSGVTVTWTTDQASSSQVDYGTTAAYGTSSPLNSTAVTSHSVTLSGLAASTTYHFRVDSGNANGLSQSADSTFATTAPPANAVIDTKVSAFSATGTVAASVSTTKTSDLLVAFVAGDQPNPPAGQTASVTGGGLTWTLARRTNAQPGTAEIWTAPAGAVLTNTSITATVAQATNVELTVIAFANSSGVGAVGGGSGWGTAPTATLTTTRANSWVFGVGFDWTAGNARTVGANQTLQDQRVQQGGTFWTQSQNSPTATSATAVTINDTAPTSDQWDLAIIEILGA